MIKIKELVEGMRVWEAYENGEEQEFVVFKVWNTEGRWYAQLDYVDDDYTAKVSEEDEKGFYFK